MIRIQTLICPHYREMNKFWMQHLATLGLRFAAYIRVLVLHLIYLNWWYIFHAVNSVKFSGLKLKERKMRLICPCHAKQWPISPSEQVPGRL